MWYNNNNTGGDKVNPNTHRNLEKGVVGGEAGPGREGSGEESQLRFICQLHTTLKMKPPSVWWSENFPFSHLL